MNIRPILLALVLLQTCPAIAGPETGDPLANGFESPPASARPHTWWHWMNGNVTKAGITADLEAMQRVGIGGVQIFNAGEGIPAGPVKFNSPEWHEMFTFAVQEANRLGIEVCLHNCAGWSSSGGPWNTPENSMQHVVMSETKVTGGQKFSGTLPAPAAKWDFYRDIAVLAFRTPEGEGTDMKSLAPTITASVPGFDGAQFLEGKTSVNLLAGKLPQQIQIEFARPFATRSATLRVGQDASDVKGVIQASDDGIHFRNLRTFATTRRPTRPLNLDLGSPATAARYFRFVFTGAGANTKSLTVNGISLSSRLRIENVDAKDGDSGAFVMSSPADDSAATNLVVERAKEIDLTSRMDASGHLDWDAPAGDWTILRIGHTPTGRENHPAPAEGTGPECDKFSPGALDAHWAGFVQKCIDDAGPLAGKGRTFNNVLIDSYEVGGQNWSADFRAEFQKRRGYDPLPFLPAFTGRVVDNPETSERFLWDVRRTISDLFAENYYGHFAELCRTHNMLSSVEPYTGPYESMQAGAAGDIPMGEFWVGSKVHSSVKLASSVGHIYGRNIIGTESFTASPGEHGRWLDDPYAIKALGDQVFCLGINRFIFHRYAMQPWTNRWPGMTMGQWGTHFDRTSTWWEQGRAWLKYVARSQFMLQQGRFVADAAYFCGESSPAEMRAGDPALPPGHDFDGIGATALAGARVQDHQLVLKSGMRYRVLVLPPSDRAMTPEVLQQISELVAGGLTLVGMPPDKSPSLHDFPGCDQQIHSLVAKMWGNCDGRAVTEHPFGKGKVVWGQPLAKVFSDLGTPPDFEFAGDNQPRLTYVHRTDGDEEIYFVSNQRERFTQANCTFRVTGRIPELWHADTGVIERAPVWHQENGRTVVSLQLDPAGSVFVVFRHRASPVDPVVAVKSVYAPVQTSAVSKLEIRRARYEAVDGSAGADVTARLAEMVDNNALNLVANNDNFGPDPADSHVKQLRVNFILDGHEQERIVPENERLVIGRPAGPGEAPVYQLHADAAGKLSVESSRAIKVELTTAAGKTLKSEIHQVPPAQEITGPWNLNFPPNWGAPPQVTLSQLKSWTEVDDQGVKYFSGTATYTREIEIAADALGDQRSLYLDLGRVKNLAEVSLNGKNLGLLWKPPFRVNLTSAAHAGKNQLEIKVTNLWPNRLIGDEQLPEDREWDGKKLKAWPQWLLDGKPSPTGRLTFTTWHHWTKDEPLLESGLLGPVRLIFNASAPVK